MYSRKEQYELIGQIRCKENETKRIDCPFCGGKKTLTVSNNDGSVIWNCYKASCPARGGKRVGYSVTAIKNKFSKQVEVPTNIPRTPLPEIKASPSNHMAVVEYLINNNVLKAFEDKAIEITYDPSKNRVLFWMNDGRGAVGRTLSGAKPKWLSYGDTAGILSVGVSDTAVVVEDAASACSVYATGKYTGVALLGTNVSPVQRHQLSKYQKIIVCLDKDASCKAIKVARSMQGLVHCSVRFLKEDLKYLNTSQILELIDESTGDSDNRL